MSETNDSSKHASYQIQSNASEPGKELVKVGGVEVTRDEASKHGWIDPTAGNNNVVPFQPTQGDPYEMTPDGVPRGVVMQAEQEYNALIHAADPVMIKQVETDLFNGVEAAEDFMYRNAPALMDQGHARAAIWADKLGVDADMLSTSLVDQSDKAAMLQALFTGNEEQFRAAIARTKNALLAEMSERGMENFEIDGETPDLHGRLRDGTSVVDLLLAGQLDIEEW